MNVRICMTLALAGASAIGCDDSKGGAHAADVAAASQALEAGVAAFSDDFERKELGPDWTGSGNVQLKSGAVHIGEASHLQTEVDLSGYTNVAVAYGYATSGKDLEGALSLVVSSDGGLTWSQPHPLAPSDGTDGLYVPLGRDNRPLLVRFQNAAVKKGTLILDSVVVRGDYGCGNGLRHGEEDCDGADLGGETCLSLGLGDGLLQCDSVTCTFDTSMCTGGGGGSGGSGGGGTGG